MKIKLISFMISLLLIAGCSIIESTVDGAKTIGESIIDESMDLGKTIISIPVQAVGTVVDKLEEETTEEENTEE
tara:strand:- start:216 stop:437 length:222 start_codon:yes stop_codon:yes gene_type:complete